jgi:hypothetical protein
MCSWLQAFTLSLSKDCLKTCPGLDNLEGWAFFARPRKARENATDQAEKHSHSWGYGEHWR